MAEFKNIIVVNVNEAGQPTELRQLEDGDTISNERLNTNVRNAADKIDSVEQTANGAAASASYVSGVVETNRSSWEQGLDAGTLANLESVSASVYDGSVGWEAGLPADTLADIVDTSTNVDSFQATSGVLATRGSVGTALIDDNAVTFAKMQNLAAGTIIGNNTGGAGDPLALTPAQVRTQINVADGATANTGALADKNTIDSGSLIDAGVVSLDKIETVADGRILGNNTGSTASPVALTPAQVRTEINVADGATANTGALADKNTIDSGSLIDAGVVSLDKIATIADGAILGNNAGSTASPTALTPAQVRTEINVADGATANTGALADKNTIDSGSLIDDGVVTLAKLADIPDNRILGNNAGIGGVPKALTAAQVRTEINVADGATANTGALADKNTVATGDIDANAVTTAKIQQISQNQFLGRTTAGTGDVEVLNDSDASGALGLGDLAGKNTIDAAALIENNVVALVKLQAINDGRILGNNTGTGASPVALTPAEVRTEINVADGATANTGALADKNTIDSASLIDANVVEVGKIQTIAKDQFLGRVTAGTGNVEILTNAQASGALGLGDLAGLNEVTNSEIADDAVNTAQLADNAVDTDRIKANNVTLAKIETISSKTMLGNDSGVTANVAEITQVTTAEKTAGTATGLRCFSPKDVKDMAATHGGGGGGGGGSFEGSAIASGIFVANPGGNPSSVIISGVDDVTMVDAPANNTVLILDTEAERFKYGKVNSDLLPIGELQGNRLANNTVSGDQLANNTITGSKLANGTVSGSQLADDEITSAKLKSGAALGNIAINSISFNELTLVGANTLVGNSAGFGGPMSDLNMTTVRTMLNVADGATANTGALADKNTIDSASLLDDSVVSLAKIADIADDTILGNNTGGAAAPVALTAAQTRGILNVDNGATQVKLLNAGFSGTGSIPTALNSVMVWDLPGLNQMSFDYNDSTGEFTIDSNTRARHLEFNIMVGGDGGSARVELNLELQKDTGSGYSAIAKADNYAVRISPGQDEGGCWLSFIDPNVTNNGDKYRVCLRRVGGGLNFKSLANFINIKLYG